MDITSVSVPRVHRIRLPIPQGPLEYVNVYLIEEDKGCMLIDTSWNSPSALSILEEQLKKRGFEFDFDITWTPGRIDFYGLFKRGSLRNYEREV